MIQDISPDKLNNTFAVRSPGPDDNILLFDDGGKLCVRIRDGEICFTTGKHVSLKEAVYLFSVNETAFFLSAQSATAAPPGFEYRTIRELRELGHGRDVFAAFTAYHLWRWYADNRFCGRCGKTNVHHPAERALQCGCCGHVVYPRINPAVIVGVIKDDCLLITRYRNGYAHNALVAGFAEIGETAEQTVQREVMEETGVRVKNIRYYKSQPWGIAQDLLMGFYCDADGDAQIRMDQDELKYAEWVRWDHIVLQPDNLSLTNEMMEHFIQERGKLFP